jgi:hypothetical protein
MQLGLMIWPVQWDLWGFNQDELGHISMHICHTASGISNIRIWNIRIWNIRIWHIRIWHIRIWNSYAKEFFFLEMILLTVLLQYLQDGTGSSSKIPTLGSPEKKRRRLMQLMLVVSLRTSFLRRGFLVTSYEVWIWNLGNDGFLSMVDMSTSATF